ncbi:endonuclease/exonuclease/phosphatase family protein [Aquipluma nitroreducens]|uniref:endonuclease/exonuclease/phosphatase family protein n=1 Tax=Aquipluma nitroreducens TaxID=2010828 RepID=UPI00296E8FF1|nr:endonuclease/exonuclease/phosphatase family protein [Aquipluma nitroreducens]
MKRFFFIILVFVSNLTIAQNVRVITYNIRFNNPDDGINAWPNRSKDVVALLDFHKADVFGLQEALISQIEDIKKQLPNMNWVGVGRDDGKKAGEFSPLFYNSKKFKALKSGWFWLSQTPEKPGLGWDAACNRVCTWLLLETDKKDRQFMVFNTHFDHQGVKARTESAKLILRKIKELNSSKLPVILTGDFNLTPEQEPIAVITKELHDSRTVTKEAPYGPNGTFNGFQFNSPLNERIDYVFVNDLVEVKQYGVLTDSKELRYPSDHLPVFVNLELKKAKK